MIQSAPRRIVLAALVLAAAIGGCSKLLHIEPGELDPSFGHGGAAASANDGSASGATACSLAADCVAPLYPDCRAVSCVAGECLVLDAPDGTKVGSQIAGDCQDVECDGHGLVKSAPADDPHDDGHECTVDTCDHGAPLNTPKAPGAACSQGGGAVCAADGNCVGCLSDADCPGKICQSATCVPSVCGNGMKDGDETDVDCGGSCGPCAGGKACKKSADCQSQVCTSGVCKPPNCNDGVQNGSETDLDCGGFCPPCKTGRACAVGADCESHVCAGAICQAPKCTDGTTNGKETDVDCGGPCPACADGKSCNANSDCAGDVCTNHLCCTPLPKATVCGNKCGMLTDNCAEPVACACAAMSICWQGVCLCMPEAATKTCFGKCGMVMNNCGVAIDCGSCATSGGVPLCADGLKDGDETDVDCGGSTCQPCWSCAACNGDSDCTAALGLTCVGGECSPCVDAGP